MAQTAESEPTADTPAPKPAGKKRLLLLIAAGAVVLLAAGGGAYFAGLLDGGADIAATAEHAAEPVATAPVFYELPDFLVTLNTGERRSTFLKVRVSLELNSDGDRQRIDRLLPRITDYCQIYLRELRLEDLRGSAGTTRLREELLRRIAAAAAPVAVTDVLFSELFVQ